MSGAKEGSTHSRFRSYNEVWPTLRPKDVKMGGNRGICAHDDGEITTNNTNAAARRMRGLPSSSQQLTQGVWLGSLDTIHLHFPTQAMKRCQPLHRNNSRESGLTERNLQLTPFTRNKGRTGGGGVPRQGMNLVRVMNL
jgi:hypothetical protein